MIDWKASAINLADELESPRPCDGPEVAVRIRIGSPACVRPPFLWDRFSLTVVKDHQQVWLDDPNGAYSFALPAS